MSRNNSDFLIPVLVIVLVVALLCSIGGGMMSGIFLGRGMMGYGFGFMGAFGWFVMALFFVALVLTIVWLVRYLERGKRRLEGGRL